MNFHTGEATSQSLDDATFGDVPYGGLDFQIDTPGRQPHESKRADLAANLPLGIPLDIGRLATYHVQKPPSELLRWGANGIDGTHSVEMMGLGFEMTMTEQVRAQIGDHGGFHKVRRDFEELIDRIMSDPHGETSIDGFKHEDGGKFARLVHEVTGPLEGLMGEDAPLAIKGTGLDVDKASMAGAVNRSKLCDQFRHTLFLERLFEEKGKDGKISDGLIAVNNVFGVVKYRDTQTKQTKEWMLMEHIKDARPMENIGTSMSTLSLDASGQPSGVELGFNGNKHRELAKLVEPNKSWHGPIEYQALAEKIYEKLGIGLHYKADPEGLLGDLNGNNILVNTDEVGRKHYTLIDIKSQ